jgi:MFS transporter, SHS family, lactate transporter
VSLNPESGTASLSGSDRWHAVTASFLGWTLDAFDFFVVVFLVDTLAANFHVTKAMIVWTLTATLATRPLGAVIFGLLADRYGRRVPLMIDVIFFSVIELACGFAPNYATFLILRTLYGIGMGGEWGVGASLAMESAPTRWRGLLSGILQSGYSVGYLLAAVMNWILQPSPMAADWHWRAMFWVGGVPALLALYIRTKVPESEAWKQHRAPSVREVLKAVAGGRYGLLLASLVPMVLWAFSLLNPGLVTRLIPLPWIVTMIVLFVLIFLSLGLASRALAYLGLMMTLFMFLSHGTQDLYPDFLRTAHVFSNSTVSWVVILYNVGAIVGAIIFGHLSEQVGRRRSIGMALALSLLVIPFWAFGGSVLVLAASAFIMQVGVQGAWGIIPAHLNELSPSAARGLVPGLAYQLGILFAAPTNTIEYALRDKLGYSWALAAFEITTIVLLLIVVALGSESKGKSFVREEPGSPS